MIDELPCSCPIPSHTHLHSSLAESQSLAEFLPHKGVWVVGLVEKALQFVELLQGEVGAGPPLLVAAASVASTSTA